jgi:Centromere DNA-binding protein complex CBF3 subunit, domain 2
MSAASNQIPEPEAEIRDEIMRAEIVRLSKENAQKKTCDKTYSQEIKNYIKFIDDRDKLNNYVRAPGEKYINRNNVDMYFAQIQSNRKVAPNTGRRVVSALNYYAKNVEYVGQVIPFEIESPVVKQSLETQQVSKRLHSLETAPDYHRKLPIQNLTNNEIATLVRYVLEHDKNYWSNFLISFTAGTQMFIRGDSVKKFKLNDLYIDDNHSVGNLKSNWIHDGQMLAVILRPLLHKERKQKTNVVGAYRHRDPYQCFTGVLAMDLFVFFNTTTTKYDFLDPAINKANNNVTEKARSSNTNYVEPEWSKISLIRGWDSPGASGTCYTSVLHANNISWEKITHMRKSGIESAASSGLDAAAIATMSKHSTDGGNSKLMTAYFTELYSPVMLS